MDRLDLGEDWWRRIQGPTEHARGLPNEAYGSEAVHRLEQRRLFARTWCFAGRASSVPAIGDVAPVEVAGLPLFMARGTDGEVRVFHNVCPHRGARLVPKCQRAKRSLVCPYHAWTYELDGRLRNRPHFDGPGRHDEGQGCVDEPVALFGVRSQRWFDWVFVDLSGEAAEFHEHMRPVLEKFGEFPLDGFAFNQTLRCEFKANWKLVAENFFDVYHVFKVHPELDRMCGGPRTSPSIDGVLLYNEYYAQSNARGGGLPEIGSLDDRWGGRCLFANLYPNLGIAFYPTNVFLVEFIPLSAGTTMMEMHFYFVANAELTPDIETARETLLAWWRHLNAEDEGICELLQLGRVSPAYPGGRLAPHWDRGTQHFARLVAQAIS